jgi:putative DNA primase/helicase
LAAARARYRAAADLTDADEKERQAKWAIRSESAERRAAALALARSERPIADNGKDWDADPWLLGVANGVVDLRTGQPRDGRPEDRITLALPWCFDPDARAERWERFITEIFNDDADLINYVWRAIGYSLSGSVREQIFFLCRGAGSNGKSLFLSILRAIFGPLAINAAFATFEFSCRQAASNDLASLADRRLVTASETAEGTRLNEARIKALTGGDTMTARYLYAEFFEFEPVAKIWLSVNHRPAVTDDSEGFWRRMREIPFTRQFLGDAADDGLGDKLKVEAEGILAWAVRGCLAWQERPLKNPPACVLAATADYRAASDPLSDFLAEHCIVGPGYMASAADLYKTYGEWATAAGLTDRDRLRRNGFGRRLGDRFTRIRDGRQGISYQGIGLCVKD